MPELQFALEFVPQEGSDGAGGISGLPEDTTLANFAIYVEDECLTRNRPRRLRLAQTKDTVFGPVAGLVEWLIENWTPILWETRTPFKRARIIDEGEGAGPPIPGVKEAAANWDGYVYQDSDIEEMADWQHRHLLGHATSDLALPSITIVPEDNSVVLAVGGLPGELGATVDFALSSVTPSKPSIYVVRKIDFRQEAVNFIDGTLEHAAQSGRHQAWVSWLRGRWLAAQEDEANPARQLFWMLGDLCARRVEELEANRPELASGLRQLLLDCRTVTHRPQLLPLEDMIDRYAVGNGLGSLWNRVPGWQSVATEAVSTSQPEFAQGYRLADLVRQKLALRDRPIRDHSEILESLDVKLESYCETELFQTAACAPRGEQAHIIPSAIAHDTFTLPKSRFAIFATLGRLLWRSRRVMKTICVAQGDYALLSEARRANAFAANLMLPREIFEGGHLSGNELVNLAEAYGISYSAARWHAHNARVQINTFDDDED